MEASNGAKDREGSPKSCPDLWNRRVSGQWDPRAGPSEWAAYC